MTASKLPEWPKRPVLSQPVTQLDVASAWHMFEHKRAEAALARMEALVELVNDMHGGNGRSKDGKNWYERRDELLAACERSVAAQPSGAGRRKS